MAPNSTPLSFGQEQLWFLAQLAPGSPVYHEQVVFGKRGRLDSRALSRSLDEIRRRHEIWRATFVSTDGGPVQVVQPHAPHSIPSVDLGGLPPEQREAEAARLAREDLLRPFDLEHGPLWRGRLVHFGEADHRLYLALHHIIFDGFSVSHVLAPELLALYEAYAGGREPELRRASLTYADYAHRQREERSSPEMARQLDYWRDRLTDLPKLGLPTDRPHPPVQSFAGRTERLSFPYPLLELLRGLAAEEGTTLFTVVLAAFVALLYRYTGQEDLVIGTLSSGRRQPQLLDVFGYFVNPLVLRVSVTGDPSFREFVSTVREVVLGAIANDAVAFEQVLNALRVARKPGRSPVFQVLFALEPPLPELPDGWKVSRSELDTGTSKFDLSVDLEEQINSIAAAFTYRTDVFDASTIDRLSRSWLNVLESAVASPETPLSELAVVGAGERLQLLMEWNQTDVDIPRRCINELFEEEADASPNRVAVTFGDRELSYEELDRRANQLAHHLRSLGVAPEARVGVCVERSFEMIVGLLGVLKAGGAYVPLDPTYPVERLAFMVEDTQPAVLLTFRGSEHRLAGIATPVVRLDADWPQIAVQPQTRLSSLAVQQSLAYVMYTSGSTGSPKGVMVEHRSVVRLVRPATYARLDSDQVLLQLATLSFDASTFEIWGALLNGGRLVIAPPGQLSARELGELVEAQGVTTLWLTAGLFNQLVDAGLPGLSTVHQLLTGGEALSPAHCRRALALLAGRQLINGYGPTEGTTFTCCHPIEPGSLLEPSVPIGRPVGGTRVYVLDPRGQPVPVGVVGELYIGGEGVARGYLNSPELTAARFLRDPFGPPGSRLYRTGDLVRYLPEGDIEFVGRADGQLKIRGYRVEPGEVESVLARHLGVRDVVVGSWEPERGDRRLVAYFTRTERRGPRPAELKSFLRERLPEFMVPAVFVELEQLPLTANGKVDRKRLPEPGAQRSRYEEEYAAPRTREEKTIARIWSRLLVVERVGLYDDFFELGGHSLLVVQMQREVAQALDRPLSVASIFRGGSTVAGLAALLNETVRPADNGTVVVPVQPYGSRPALFFLLPHESGIVALRHYALALGPNQPVVGLVPPRRNHQFDRAGAVRELIVPLQAAIRERQPRGPYYLCGHSLGGLLAYEIAGELLRQGETVGWLGLLDALTPTATRAAAARQRTPSARLQRFLIRAQRVRKQGLLRAPGAVWAMGSRFGRRLGAALGLPLLLPEQFDEAGALHLAVRHHVFPHDIPLDVFATSFGSWATGSPALGWETVHCGEIHCHPLIGDHLSPLQQPHASGVVEMMAVRLHEAQSKSSPAPSPPVAGGLAGDGRGPASKDG